MTALNKNKLLGFLYHSGSQQILLQQRTKEGSEVWEQLEDLAHYVSKGILPVYDYVAKGQKYFISYAEIKETNEYPATKNCRFKWFSPKEISKLPMTPQTKQDLIVCRRVIDSQIRKNAGERSIG